MKRLLAIVSLAAFALPAQARLLPNDQAAVRSTLVEDAVLYAGPIGVMLEKDYFRASSAQYGGDLCSVRLAATDRRPGHACD